MVKKRIVQQVAAQLPTGYRTLLGDLKKRIKRAQISAALAANCELVMLYWQIGRAILKQQRAGGWGAKVTDKLADDLRLEFPDMKGFSSRNIKYMRAFAVAYPDKQIVHQLGARFPHYVRQGA